MTPSTDTAQPAGGPTDFARRSPLYREHLAAGATHMPLGGGAGVATYGRTPEAEAETALELGLADLSLLPRTGFKGWHALAWLREQGIAVPEANNRAGSLAGGGFAARLADTELLLTGPLDGAADTFDGLLTALGEAKPSGVYPVPRSDGSAWLTMTGRHAPSCMAKLCGVDLRSKKFPEGCVAQTSVARLNAVVVRADLGSVFALHLFFDSASAGYFWRCLVDAAVEYRGAPVGVLALRRLAAEVTPATGRTGDG